MIKKSGFGGLTPAGIVITGGGAQTVGATEVAKRILAMSCRVGIPTQMTGLIDEIQTPVFATGVGLVLYGAKAEFLGKKVAFITLPKISGLPVRGIAQKTIDFFKSFLP